MKIQLLKSVRRNERGMATFIFIALLAIMMILVTAESRALYQLHREVKLLAQQQARRLNGSNSMQTNAVATTLPQTQ